jgi:lysyl-tRNA synthetase class 2
MDSTRPEEFEHRVKKLDRLRELGIEPYPYRFEGQVHASEVKSRFDELEGKPVRVAGRVMSKRVFGKTIFSHLRDRTGDIQVYLRADDCGPEAVRFFKETVDVGDIVGASGDVFKTKTGEITVGVKELRLLSKGLLPLPEKWHGITDKELIYRDRYLDLLVNEETRDLFRESARVIRRIRDFLDDRGFLEVKTPVLQPIYGGASARPFKTRSKALDMELYLRISDELYLKRLLVAGLERVYEFTTDFRNEGIDRSHYPEFTILEAYAAYWDYTDMMEMTEELVTSRVEEIKGTAELEYQGRAVRFDRPFERISFTEALSERLQADVLSLDENALREKAREAGIEGSQGLSRARLVDKLFDIHVGDHLVRPTFVLDHPLFLSPLAKRHRENEALVERFELFAFGFELANAFSELNDPIDQRERLENQVELRKQGDEEMPAEVDEDFLRALEYGMPPAAGIGFGVERLLMLLFDRPSIRDVILFPQLRPKR